VALALFILCIAGIAWTLFGYPLLMRLMPRAHLVHTPDEVIPTVSVILTVFNEASSVRQKLLNTLELDWPADRLQLIVVSDGSTDNTAEVVASVADPRIRFIELATRSGKHVAQGAGVQRADSQILVFTDVATLLPSSSLRLLMRGFADPHVGCVSGVDRVTSVDGAVEGDALYVRYEMHVRRLESRSGSIVCASGCFFAVRRELCEAWSNELTSDFAIPMSLALRGIKSISDPEAICTYHAVRSSEAEFERKVRTITHGLRVVWVLRACLNPFRCGFFSIKLISHKVLRWALPYMFVGALIAGIYEFTIDPLMAIGFLGLAAMLLVFAATLVRPLTRFAGVRWCVFAVISLAASVVALSLAFVRNDAGIWEPTKR